MIGFPSLMMAVSIPLRKFLRLPNAKAEDNGKKVSIPLRKFLRRAIAFRRRRETRSFHPSKEVFEASVAIAKALGVSVFPSL